MATTTHRNDWVSNYRTYAIGWGVPAAVLVASAFAPIPIRTVVWVVTLVWMGVACLFNAFRCKRLHCYMTGPFFLFMASVVLLHGSAAVPLGPNAWPWLGLAIVGGVITFRIPEAIWGKYRGNRGSKDRSRA